MFPALLLSLALSWVQVKSDTFVVKSSVGEERATKVLRELEDFHQLVGKTVVFRKVELPELPVEVLIVGDQAQLKELSPDYNGKKLEVAGYYQRGQDRDFIVLAGTVKGNLAHVVYHELTHYFLSRALDFRPTWLNEGLAEYFSTADIEDDSIYLGAPSPERLQILKTNRFLPLKEFLAVDNSSPYYNENSKANVFYTQAWAFVHFLMHGPYQEDFKRYLELLRHQPADLFDVIKTDPRVLEHEFETYMNVMLRAVGRERIRTEPQDWTMAVQAIPDAEVDLSIAEIFLSSGKLDKAQQYLEQASGRDDELPRASYYRGVLARITGEGDPREFFIDALLDPNLGPRAAVQLVQLHELSIPAVRRALEQAAASGTHMADVYWALSEIYLDDVRRLEETARLNRLRAKVDTPLPMPARRDLPPEPDRAPTYSRYAQGREDHVIYDLLSESGEGPQAEKVIAPYFPDELLKQRLTGQVVLDVQVTDTGEVGGVWLISATPDIFGTLATSAIRDWKFEANPMKIRVMFYFKP